MEYLELLHIVCKVNNEFGLGLLKSQFQIVRYNALFSWFQSDCLIRQSISALKSTFSR